MLLMNHLKISSTRINHHLLYGVVNRAMIKYCVVGLLPTIPSTSNIFFSLMGCSTGSGSNWILLTSLRLFHIPGNSSCYLWRDTKALERLVIMKKINFGGKHKNRHCNFLADLAQMPKSVNTIFFISQHDFMFRKGIKQSKIPDCTALLI